MSDGIVPRTTSNYYYVCLLTMCMYIAVWLWVWVVCRLQQFPVGRPDRKWLVKDIITLAHRLLEVITTLAFMLVLVHWPAWTAFVIALKALWSVSGILVKCYRHALPSSEAFVFFYLAVSSRGPKTTCRSATEKLYLPRFWALKILGDVKFVLANLVCASTRSRCTAEMGLYTSSVFLL